MATLIGNASKPSGGGWESWSDTFNQASELLTMPERGRLTRIGVWVAGVGQTSTATVCAWSTAGALLAESAPFTIASRPGANGNVDLYVHDLATPIELDAGAQFLAGFWRDKARSHQLTGRSSGAHRDKKNTTPSMVAPHTGGHGFGDYSVGVHAYYEPIAGAWIRRSGAWVRAEDVQVRRSGAWASVDRVQVRRAGAWTDAD
jgi:hypothetical protein